LLIQFESLHNGFNYLIIMIIVTLSKVIKHLYIGYLDQEQVGKSPRIEF
jgi:hypothetical protein